MKNKSLVITGGAGFTATELMVIIAILAILALITIPSYLSWVPRYHLRGAARDVYSNLQLAKLDAVKRNNSSTVQFNTGTNTYGIDMNNDGTDDRTISLEDYGTMVSFTNTFNMDTRITFNSRGMATFTDPDGDSIGEIFITNSQNTSTYSVEVNRIGTITLINQ